MSEALLLQDALNLLRRMVATPSETFSEEAVCSLIARQAGDWGLSARRYGNNLVVSLPAAESGAPLLALDAHIDTVPAAASYTRNPLEAGDDPEKVWGLGSNDDGGSVVAMLAVLRHYLSQPGRVSLLLNLCCEEERAGAHGAQFLYGPEGPYATGELPTPQAVIVGEPTGLEAATSERGLLVLDGLAEGVSGHAARNEGVNALYRALDDIQRLREHRFSRVSPVMGQVHLNVTQIQAGTAHNVIPDRCTFVVDVRPTEQYGNAQLLEELQGLCRWSRLTPRRLDNRSSCTPAEGRLMRAVQAAGLPTYSSPTTSDWIRIPYPAVKLGPGQSARSHKADEYILASEIAGAISTYIRLIDCYGNTLE